MGAQRTGEFRTGARVATGHEGPDRRFNQALSSSLCMLRGRALMLAGHGPLSEDFVQATFERALRAVHRPPVHEMHPWLVRILKNVAIDHWRSAKVRQSCELDPECTPAPFTAEEPEWWHELDAAALAGAARTLPRTFRRLFLLRLEGISNNEIGRRMGLKATTVATRFFRGRPLMQQALVMSRQGHRNVALAASCRGGPFVRLSAGGGMEWPRARSI